MFRYEKAGLLAGPSIKTPDFFIRSLVFVAVLLLFLAAVHLIFGLSELFLWTAIVGCVAVSLSLMTCLLFCYIADLKEASLRLKQSETLLKEAEALSHYGSWEWSQDTDVFFWSDEMYRIHGFAPDSTQVDLRFYLKLIHPDDVQHFVTILAETQHNLKSFDIDYRIVRPDGGIRYLSLIGKFKTDASGNVMKILGTAQDVTDLRTTARLLEKSESIYRTIAKNVPDSAVFLFDKQLSLILSSGPVLSRIDPQGRVLDIYSYLRMVFKDDYVKVRHVVQDSLAGKENRFEQCLEARVYKITCIPVYLAGGEVFGIMIVMHDISDMKKIQQDLEVKVTELNRSNKDLEQFAYIASHDLQEPLRKIRAFSERLNVKYSSFLPEEGLDYINRMGSASERMQLLIDDLLTFSRISRPAEELSLVDIEKAVRRVLHDLEFQIERQGVQIELKCGHQIPVIPSLFHQLLQNLLSNSLKFVRKDCPQTIYVRSELTEGSGLGLNSNKMYCKIEIADNGIGFDNQYAEKIFSMFHRLHSRNEYEGTGIGLAICKKIVENHNGIIQAEGKENEGALFRIILPIE